MSDTAATRRHDALVGIRVLDFTTAMAGPYCTRWLADLGAEVIKIESHDGDLIRNRGPLREGLSTPFGHFNCGKKSIAIDLKQPAAADIVKALVAKSDIVVENFRPGVMKRLGFDYASLRTINPRLIFCAISGYGQSGRHALLPAVAPTLHAASGYDMENFHYQGNMDRPAKTGTYVGDMLGAVFAFSAIQTALYHRERSGEGQFIDTALMDGMVNLLVYEMQDAQFPPSHPRHLYQPVRAADGFLMVAPMTQANFEALCEATGHSDWRTDSRFAKAPDRNRNWDEFMRAVETWTSARSGAESESLLLAAGVPCARYRTAAEMMRDPYFAEREAFARIEDAAGSYLVTNLPFKMSAMRIEARGTAPALGEHTDAVLAGLLQMGQDEITALRQRGAVK